MDDNVSVQLVVVVVFHVKKLADLCSVGTVPSYVRTIVGLRTSAFFTCTKKSVGEGELVRFRESQQQTAVIVQLITASICL